MYSAVLNCSDCSHRVLQCIHSVLHGILWCFIVQTAVTEYCSAFIACCIVFCGASLFRLQSQSTALYRMVLHCSDCNHSIQYCSASCGTSLLRLHSQYRVLQSIMWYFTVQAAFTYSTAVHHVVLHCSLHSQYRVLQCTMWYFIVHCIHNIEY